MQTAPRRSNVAQFSDFIREESHPCVMAKSVLAHDAVEFGTYTGRLGSPRSARALCEDLYRSLAAIREGFWSFVALFPEDGFANEAQFERALWLQLQRMHDLDAPLHAWDDSVSSDPADAQFSFSIGGRAWYVIGMHPKASRKARRLGMVALVFNSHAQFQELRSRGRYHAVRDRIRERDRLLQGSVNPMVADHGATSEARQYSGRAVDDAWRCPFHAAAKTGKKKPHLVLASSKPLAGSAPR